MLSYSTPFVIVAVPDVSWLRPFRRCFRERAPHARMARAHVGRHLIELVDSILLETVSRQLGVTHGCPSGEHIEESPLQVAAECVDRNVGARPHLQARGVVDQTGRCHRPYGTEEQYENEEVTPDIDLDRT